MSEKQTIPKDIEERLKYFQEEVEKYFSFLSKYGYILDKVETGRKDHLLDYYCELTFINGTTKIWINYDTDILNGSLIAYPNEEQRPVIDNFISINIIDPNAFMDINQFAETIHSKYHVDDFSIEIDIENINYEITRVLKNFADFFQSNLVEVLKKQKIYECLTNRFYEKIFREIPYQ